jgi:hypothetical protein
MIENIVARAKKMAVKELIEGGEGLRMQHLLDACIDEFKENEDLPNTTNPDDWARISGKKGERIVYIRTLVTGTKGTEPAGRSTRSPTPASTFSPVVPLSRHTGFPPAGGASVRAPGTGGWKHEPRSALRPRVGTRPHHFDRHTESAGKADGMAPGGEGCGAPEGGATTPFAEGCSILVSRTTGCGQ